MIKNTRNFKISDKKYHKFQKIRFFMGKLNPYQKLSKFSEKTKNFTNLIFFDNLIKVYCKILKFPIKIIIF